MYKESKAPVVFLLCALFMVKNHLQTTGKHIRLPFQKSVKCNLGITYALHTIWYSFVEIMGYGWSDTETFLTREIPADIYIPFNKVMQMYMYI